MVGNKKYPIPKGYILNTVHDVIELLKGKLIMSDTRLGRVHYQVSMYGYDWELLYVVTEKGINKTEVALRVIGERKDKKKEIRREFALLDSMLGGGADVKFSDG